MDCVNVIRAQWDNKQSESHADKPYTNNQEYTVLTLSSPLIQDNISADTNYFQGAQKNKMIFVPVALKFSIF
jgi:hypothetical protein